MIKKIRNLLTVILFAFTGLGSALAQPVKFALCYDISKAYTFITPQLIQATRDYAQLLNLKGGIEGHQIEIMAQDHGNEPQEPRPRPPQGHRDPTAARRGPAGGDRHRRAGTDLPALPPGHAAACLARPEARHGRP